MKKLMVDASSPPEKLYGVGRRLPFLLGPGLFSGVKVSLGGKNFNLVENG